MKRKRTHYIKEKKVKLITELNAQPQIMKHFYNFEEYNTFKKYLKIIVFKRFFKIPLPSTEDEVETVSDKQKSKEFFLTELWC